MKNKILIFFLISIVLSGCVGVASKGIFGTGVSVAFDPRSVGTQIDDSIMQKNFTARMILLDKKHLLLVNSKVLDGRIFLTGKVDTSEEKLIITKKAWEIKGARSVKNDIKINMTLTNPNCPVAGTMPEMVGKSVEKIKNINSIEVSLIWEPKWNKDLMSEDAKLALDIF